MAFFVATLFVLNHSRDSLHSKEDQDPRQHRFANILCVVVVMMMVFVLCRCSLLLFWLSLLVNMIVSMIVSMVMIMSVVVSMSVVMMMMIVMLMIVMLMIVIVIMVRVLMTTFFLFGFWRLRIHFVQLRLVLFLLTHFPSKQFRSLFLRTHSNRVNVLVVLMVFHSTRRQ